MTGRALGGNAAGRGASLAAFTEGSKIGRDVLHFLSVKAGRLGLHRGVPAGFLLVCLQGADDVEIVLATQLRYPVSRVGVTQSGGTVATHAGLGKQFTLFRVAGCQRPLSCQKASCQRQCAEKSIHDESPEIELEN